MIKKWRVDIIDILFFVYMTAFIKQFLVEGNLLVSWIISCIGALLIVCIKIKYLDEEKKSINRYFVLIVIIPLFFVFAIRMLIPDISFDVISSRLLASERFLKGSLFIKGDYFPIFPVNPMPEIITGIFRNLLGYRMGTIANLFAIIWTAILLNHLLKVHFKNNYLRAFLVLFIVSTENVFFEINNYMTDLLCLPLLLQAVINVLNLKETNKNKYLYMSYIAFLLGICVAYKLTNIVYLIPICVILVCFIFQEKKINKLSAFFLIFLSALLPSLPSLIYLYTQTGNPVFPFYNNIFKSPYYDAINFKDTRWGPKGFVESLIWPLKLIFIPNRISELPVYSGRISISLLICLFGLSRFFIKKQRNDKFIILSFLLFSSSILWSFSTGYIRYAIFIEILGGLLFAYVLKSFYDDIANNMTKIISITIVSTIIIASQLVATGYYTSKYEWSMRQTFFKDPQKYLLEARYLFRDYSLQNFLTQDTTNILKDVDVWILSTNFTNSIQEMSKPNLPTINLIWYSNSQLARKKLNESLQTYKGKKMYTLIHKTDLNESVKRIMENGLEVGQTIPIKMPYYSKNTTVFDMILIEVLQPNEVTRSVANSFLVDEAFKAKLDLISSARVLKSGSNETIYVKVENLSNILWPAKGNENGMFQIKQGNHWSKNGIIIINDDGRSSFEYDIRPNQEVLLPLTIHVPNDPGEYTLDIDLLQEGNVWFSQKGSIPLSIKINVQ